METLKIVLEFSLSVVKGAGMKDLDDFQKKI